jgi:hypothetical protein
MKQITRDKIAYFALGVIAGAILFTFVLGFDGDEFSLYTANFVVFEENTESSINVGVSVHPIEFDIMATGSLPYHIELKEGGPYRVTFVDYSYSECKIHISADGYESKTIPVEAISRISGKTTTAVTDFTPTPIYLKKIDPVGAGQRR